MAETRFFCFFFVFLLQVLHSIGHVPFEECQEANRKILKQAFPVAQRIQPCVPFFGEGFPFKLNQPKKDARFFPMATGHLSLEMFISKVG